MKSIMNEKGAATLTYVLMIFMVLVIMTPIIMLTANTSADNTIRSNNEKIANYLAASGMETFIAYLDTYSSGDRATFINNYSGFTEQNITLPEGTTATYKLEKTGPANNIYTISMTASAGTGKYRVTPTPLTYQITANSGTGTTIDPSNRTAVAASPEQVYVQGSYSGVPSGVQVKSDSGLSQAIGVAIDSYQTQVNSVIASYESQAVSCVCTNASDITTKINNSTSNPVILKMSSNITISSNITWGTSSKPVVLIFENLTLNEELTLNITGELLIKKDFTIQKESEVTVNQAGSNYGNLYDLGKFTGDKNLELVVANTIYSGSMKLVKESTVTTGKLIVDNASDSELVIDKEVILTVSSDILAGKITIDKETNISTTGDILVQNNFVSDKETNLTAGGNVVVGGDYISGKDANIFTGGGTTSLVLNSSGGSGSGTGWNPSAK